MSYFLFVPLRSFFLCYSGEALEDPISTGVSNKKLNNIDSNNGILIAKNTMFIYIYIITLLMKLFGIFLFSIFLHI